MGLYTASLWTLLTSSANIPPFSPSVYTLKATIDNTGHVLPGSPYVYPINLSPGQNLYTIFTAPSGSNVVELLCLSSSFRATPGRENDWRVRMSLRSGSCASSGSHTNTTGGPIFIYFTAIDNNNEYYYLDTDIAINASFGEITFPVNGYNTLVSVTLEIWGSTNLDYEIIPCGTCGQPNSVYFDNDYVVVQPMSITSSTFPAQLVVISGSNYGAKVSSSVNGLFANTDIEIGWAGDTPKYYTASFGSVYYSTAISASVQRNDCGSGYTGSFELYTLPVSQSSATSSQVDAQNLAQAYFNSTSQSYANTYGSCISTGSGAQTLDVYAKYINTNDDVYYKVNGGSLGLLGTPASTLCSGLVPITGLLVGDLVEFETSLLRLIGGSTSSCPAVPGAGCSYPYTVVSGSQSVYLTIRGDIAC